MRKSKFVTDFYLKSEIFDSHFAKQCFPIKSNSRIQLKFLQATEKKLSGVKFSKDDVLLGIRKLDPSETVGHNKINTL